MAEKTPHIAALSRVFRIQVGIGGEFFGQDIGQLASQVHHFVVAKQRVYFATGGLSLRLQTPEQVHDLARVGATVQKITGSDKVAVTGNPVVLAVGDARCDQQDDDG